VIILPARDRQIELDVGELRAGPSETAARLDQEIHSGNTRNTTFLLTGDSGLVRLQGAVFYQISDASAYVLESEHVGAALRRLFAASAVAVCAGRDLDAIVIARGPAETDAQHVLQSRQERFRADLVAEVNRRLSALAADGAGLGITVSRIDLTASLPAEAKAAFDQVLSATQTADREVAVARADAARITQSAHQEQERILSQAAALGAERASDARTRTASITAINPRYAGVRRQALVNRLYFERIAALLRKAGRVDAIDPRSASRLYLPGRAE
jgi:regulator of protease activity HflC (stomatin/prohibitin superfamily)